MSFIEQTSKLFSGTAECKFQVMLFGRDALYLEGTKPVKIDKTEMIFKVKGSLITVSGEELAVKDIVEDCIAIVGRISGIAVVDL